MDENRRSFLKKAGSAALGVGCGVPLLGAAHSVVSRSAGDDEAGCLRQWAMVVDVPKCLQASVYKACRKACHDKHNVPFIPDPDKPNPERENPEYADREEEVKWIWKEEYKDVFPDQVHGSPDQVDPDTARNEMPVLVLCNHCSNPPCVKVCPTGATWKRKRDGVVMMDMHRCIGCRYCMAACPYGARSFNWKDPRERDSKTQELLYFENNEVPADYPVRAKGVVEKCSFCTELIREWERRIREKPDRIEEEPEPVPACIQALSDMDGGEGALTFGDLNKEDSAVRDKLRENRTICRRVSLGTGPNVFYIV